VTVFHLRDLATNKRMRVSCDHVRVFQVPQYEGLAIEHILKFSESYQNVRLALPLLDREVNKLPRDYICNLVHTIVKEPFVEWVKSQIDARNQKIKEEQDMYIGLDPEIARIFEASTLVSGKLTSLVLKHASGWLATTSSPCGASFMLY